MNEVSSLELSVAPLDGENNIANANDYQVRFSNIFELTHSTGSAKSLIRTLVEALGH